MRKVTFWQVAAVAILLATMLFAGLSGQEAWGRQPLPATDGTAPDRPAVQQAAEPAQLPEVGELRTGRMALAQAARQTPAEPTASFAYSLKKENKERTIVPGVTICPEGQGVSIKLPKKDETIQLRRNTTDPACDYQVVWQRKY